MSWTDIDLFDHQNFQYFLMSIVEDCLMLFDSIGVICNVSMIIKNELSKYDLMLIELCIL